MAKKATKKASKKPAKKAAKVSKAKAAKPTKAKAKAKAKAKPAKAKVKAKAKTQNARALPRRPLPRRRNAQPFRASRAHPPMIRWRATAQTFSNANAEPRLERVAPMARPATRVKCRRILTPPKPIRGRWHVGITKSPLRFACSLSQHEPINVSGIERRVIMAGLKL